MNRILIFFVRVAIPIAVFTLIAVYFIKNSEKPNQKQTVYKVNTGNDEMVIPYCQYNGRDVCLVFFEGHRLALRVSYIPELGSSAELEFLKNRVEEIAANQTQAKIFPAEWGKCLCYFGGYPTWAPWHSTEAGGSFYVSLMFSEHSFIKGDTIYARGDKERSGSYYPYFAKNAK